MSGQRVLREHRADSESNRFVFSELLIKDVRNWLIDRYAIRRVRLLHSVNANPITIDGCIRFGCSWFNTDLGRIETLRFQLIVEPETKHLVRSAVIVVTASTLDQLQWSISPECELLGLLSSQRSFKRRSAGADWDCDVCVQRQGKFGCTGLIYCAECQPSIFLGVLDSILKRRIGLDFFLRCQSSGDLRSFSSDLDIF